MATHQDIAYCYKDNVLPNRSYGLTMFCGYNLNDFIIFLTRGISSVCLVLWFNSGHVEMYQETSRLSMGSYKACAFVSLLVPLFMCSWKSKICKRKFVFNFLKVFWAEIPLKQVAKTNHSVNGFNLRRRKQKVNCRATTLPITILFFFILLLIQKKQARHLHCFLRSHERT